MMGSQQILIFFIVYTTYHQHTTMKTIPEHIAKEIKGKTVDVAISLITDIDINEENKIWVITYISHRENIVSYTETGVYSTLKNALWSILGYRWYDKNNTTIRRCDEIGSIIISIHNRGMLEISISIKPLMLDKRETSDVSQETLW